MLRTLPPLNASMILSIVAPLILQLPDDLYQRLLTHPYQPKKNSSSKKYSTLPRNFVLNQNSPTPANSIENNFTMWMNEQQNRRTPSNPSLQSPKKKNSDPTSDLGTPLKSNSSYGKLMSSANNTPRPPPMKLSGSGEFSPAKIRPPMVSDVTPEPTTPMKSTPKVPSLIASDSPGHKNSL